MRRRAPMMLTLPELQQFGTTGQTNAELEPRATCSKCGAFSERVDDLERWLPDRGTWVRQSGLHCTRRSKASLSTCGFLEVVEEIDLPDKPAPFGCPPSSSPTQIGKGESPMPRSPEPRTMSELTEEEKAEMLSALLDHHPSEVAAKYRLNPHAFNVYRSRIRAGAHKRVEPSAERLSAVVSAWQRGADPAALIEAFGLEAEELTAALAGKKRDLAVPVAGPVTPRPVTEVHHEEPLVPAVPSDVTADAAPMEPLDVIEAWDLDFSLGSAVYHIAKAVRGGDLVAELRQAQIFIGRAIQRRERAS